MRGHLTVNDESEDKLQDVEVPPVPEEIPRLPLRSVQRVSISDICSKCKQRGRRVGRRLWLSCDVCQQWFHRTCAEVSASDYKKIAGKEWRCVNC
nr:PHD finger protein ALFIN-LIKE 2-like [Crassostrea virginica]